MSNGAVQPMMLPLEGSGYSADHIHANVTCMDICKKLKKRYHSVYNLKLAH